MGLGSLKRFRTSQVVSGHEPRRSLWMADCHNSAGSIINIPGPSWVSPLDVKHTFFPSLPPSPQVLPSPPCPQVAIVTMPRCQCIHVPLSLCPTVGIPSCHVATPRCRCAHRPLSLCPVVSVPTCCCRYSVPSVCPLAVVATPCRRCAHFPPSLCPAVGVLSCFHHSLLLPSLPSAISVPGLCHRALPLIPHPTAPSCSLANVALSRFG
ncbi:hypothetical protein KP509_33G051200 [Ceratopteris richardii]|uniref:Uncharacterized protein n=1 Tax=Ceratopteris richardii TaxID=49495 RepID=A0A8T2QQP8_CERRI|nr:hypothetical protein KP509_33G051200 [Ceratopteris richardii]